jgi:hypothetical protein
MKPTHLKQQITINKKKRKTFRSAAKYAMKKDKQKILFTTVPSATEILDFD